MSAARAATTGMTVRSNSSARMVLNWDWVAITEAIKVALTRTIASQKERKIFRKRLRISDSLFAAYQPTLIAPRRRPHKRTQRCELPGYAPFRPDKPRASCAGY